MRGTQHEAIPRHRSAWNLVRFASDAVPFVPGVSDDAGEYRSTVTCPVFRTFHGWTALLSTARTEGVLNVLPIPHAMAYLLLRIADDVADDDLCGAANGRSLPVTEAHHGVPGCRG
ncbi:MAG: YbiU family protein [Solirubrobacteraceae bacterium]